MLRTAINTICALALVALPAAGETLLRYDLEPDQVLMTYQVSFGRHQVSGTSRSLEWSISPLPGGSAQLRLRVPIESFQSGHPKLDELLRRAVDSERYPFVEIEGVARAGASPVQFAGTIGVRGVTRPISTSLHLQRIRSMVAVWTSFSVDVDALGIALPAVETSRPEKKVDITFAARLRAHPSAVASGGFLNRQQPPGLTR